MSERPVRSLHERPEDNHDPPIGDYGVIGNCRTAGLVSKGGSLDWLCLPNFSGPAVFAALLDRARGGRWTIRPDQPFEVERSYVNDTNVLETRFRTASGEARLVDLMPLRNEDAPRELAPDHEVLRIIEGTAGEVTFEVTFEPRPDYGRAPVRVSRRGRCTFACDFRAHLFLLHAERPLEHDPERAALSGQVTVRAGERCRFSLAYMHGRPAVIPALGAAADQRLEQTRRWWQGWSERCRYGGPFRPQVVRSILALKLLTFAPSGAMLAAATASLPERPGGSDNFDYRYCWVRDSALAVRAFVSLGYQDEADAFMRWLLNATRLSKPRLQVMYDVYGGTQLDETLLEHLRGYAGSQPVRIGNQAHSQLQLDIYGELIMAAHQFVEAGGELDRYEARWLVNLGKTVCRLWREPDHGVWEFRDRRRHYVYSKVMCWVALNRLIELAGKGVIRIPKDTFEAERNAIRAAIEHDGFDTELDSYVAAFGERSLDASLLLIALQGYRQANDPRMRSTFERIEHVLGAGSLVRRYGDARTPMAANEPAFGICSFWSVAYLAAAGRTEEASERFEHVLAYANDLGLFAEEIDPMSGRALGNFPQAFTLIGLINAAAALAGCADCDRLEAAS